MLSVSSLKSFDFFQNFDLIAGHAGIFRNVTNVVILDFEGIEDHYYGFQSGDFVITNLLFAKDNPERIYHSFKALIDLGVSAFAIKTVFYTDLPQEVLDLANEYEVPIFTFHHIFIEDVIINITDYLRASTNYDYYEKLIDQFTTTASHISDIQQFLNALDIQEQSGYTTSVYLTPKGPANDFSIQRLTNKLQFNLKTYDKGYQVSVIKYKNGMLFFAFFHSRYPVPSKLKTFWRSIFRTLSIDINQYLCGVNDSILPSTQIDLSIRRCFYAHQYCQHQNLDYSAYTDLDVLNIVWPILDDSYISAHILELIQKVEPACNSIHDFKNSTLYPTVKAYVDCSFDIATTAESLYTHQNTVRYRIKKLRESFQIQNEIFFRILLYAIVSCTH